MEATIVICQRKIDCVDYVNFLAYQYVSVHTVYSYTHIYTCVNLNIYDIYWDVDGITEKYLNKSGQKGCCRGG